jgi:spermidine synthase
MRKRVFAAVLVALVFSIVPETLAAQAGQSPITRYDRDSQYYRIIVTDYPHLDRRILYFSRTRGAQSSMILSNPTALGLAYLRTLMASFPLHKNPKNVLILGLGGAAIPKFLAEHYPDIQVDIVEIDPDVVKVAQQYFQFKPTPSMKVYAIDGRLFLKQVDKKYDLIILDAYASDSIPFHLTTVEFFNLVKERLAPDGVIAANLWEYFVNRYFLAELKTVRSVFPRTYLFSTPDPASKVLFATMSDVPVTREEWAVRAAGFAGDRKYGYDLSELVRREYEEITDKVITEEILTDDMAAVDLLRTKRAE